MMIIKFSSAVQLNNLVSFKIPSDTGFLLRFSGPSTKRSCLFRGEIVQVHEGSRDQRQNPDQGSRQQIRGMLAKISSFLKTFRGFRKTTKIKTTKTSEHKAKFITDALNLILNVKAWLSFL
jgi:hypothetical protein